MNPINFGTMQAASLNTFVKFGNNDETETNQSPTGNPADYVGNEDAENPLAKLDEVMIGQPDTDEVARLLEATIGQDPSLVGERPVGKGFVSVVDPPDIDIQAIFDAMKKDWIGDKDDSDTGEISVITTNAPVNEADFETVAREALPPELAGRTAIIPFEPLSDEEIAKIKAAKTAKESDDTPDVQFGAADDEAEQAPVVNSIVGNCLPEPVDQEIDPDDVKTKLEETLRNGTEWLKGVLADLQSSDSDATEPKETEDTEEAEVTDDEGSSLASDLAEQAKARFEGGRKRLGGFMGRARDGAKRAAEVAEGITEMVEDFDA